MDRAQPETTEAPKHVLDPTESGVIHTVEYEVRRLLLAVPGVDFQSLVVRRVPDGICLEGTCDDLPVDVAAVVRDATGIEVVKNHLVVKSTSDFPAKG